MKALRLLALLLFGLLWLPSQADAAARFAVCTTTCTWDNVSTAMWSGSSGGATGQSAPGSGDTVTLDAATCVGGTTCTITINANLNVTSITFGACTATTTGCIIDAAANNNSVTAQTISGTGSGTRTLNCGTNTWAFTATTGTIFDLTSTTNMTVNCGSATFTASASATGARTLALGSSKSFGTVNIANTGATGFYTDIVVSTATTIATLNLTAPVFLRFASTATYNITNAPTWAGTAFNNLVVVQSANNAPTVSVASGTANLSWAMISNVAFTGGATFVATNSFDGKGNTGITITGPSGGGGRCIGC